MNWYLVQPTLNKYYIEIDIIKLNMHMIFKQMSSILFSFRWSKRLIYSLIEKANLKD